MAMCRSSLAVAMPPKATDCCAAAKCRDGPLATKVRCSKSSYFNVGLDQE